jgi:hypothetical protein
MTRRHTPPSVGLLWTRDRPVAETSTWQHKHCARDEHPCPRWDSNPRSQHASGRRPTPYTARPLGSAKFYTHKCKCECNTSCDSRHFRVGSDKTRCDARRGLGWYGHQLAFCVQDVTGKVLRFATADVLRRKRRHFKNFPVGMFLWWRFRVAVWNWTNSLREDVRAFLHVSPAKGHRYLLEQRMRQCFLTRRCTHQDKQTRLNNVRIFRKFHRSTYACTRLRKLGFGTSFCGALYRRAVPDSSV